MVVYPNQSKYTSIITVTDDNGVPVNIGGADEVVYTITSRRGGDEELYRITDDDPNFEIQDNDNEFNIAEIFIEAEDVTWTGTVWEELRVRFDADQSTVVFQDPVIFNTSSTQP